MYPTPRFLGFCFLFFFIHLRFSTLFISSSAWSLLLSSSIILSSSFAFTQSGATARAGGQGHGGAGHSGADIAVAGSGIDDDEADEYEDVVVVRDRT